MQIHLINVCTAGWGLKILFHLRRRKISVTNYVHTTLFCLVTKIPTCSLHFSKLCVFTYYAQAYIRKYMFMYTGLHIALKCEYQRPIIINFIHTYIEILYNKIQKLYARLCLVFSVQ
jgi:hypothetical protein